MLTPLVLSALLSQSPGLLGPLEETLDLYSFGPTIAAHALIDRDGVAPAFAAGFSVVSWDVEKTYEPRCLEHRKREREQLGGDGNPLGDMIGEAQQECPAIDERANSTFAVGAELEVAVRAQRELSLRTYGTLLSLYRSLGLGMSGTLALADRSGSTAVGVRGGLELSWRQRFGHKGFRPVLQPFVFGEVTLLGRDNFTDQLGAGLRFLYDL